VTLLVGACSLAFDANRVQCTTDADCVARGADFADSVCVAQLCRVAPCRGADCAGSVDNEPDACVGKSCLDAAPPRDAARPSAVVPPRDAGKASETEADVVVPAVEADAESMSPPVVVDAGMPECVLDSDCTRDARGAFCVDSVCWSAPNVNRCAVDQDCTALGPEYVAGKCVEMVCRPNPRWRCERPPPRGLSESVTLNILVRNSLSLAPITGVSTRVCEKLDLTCAEPIAQVSTNAEGHLVVPVPAGFAGYLQLEDERFLPALYFLPQVLPSNGELQPIPLLGRGVVDGLALSLGATIDKKRGHMMLIAEDCFGEPLAGVTFNSTMSDKTTIQFYVRDLLPSTSVTETGEIGNGGYLNFPAGNAVIGVTMVATKLELTTFSVVVRPGFITVAYVRPDLR